MTVIRNACFQISNDRFGINTLFIKQKPSATPSCPTKSKAR